MALNIGDDYCPNNTTDGFGKFPNWLFKADLSDQAKIMWCKLSQYARDKESCFPKQDTLAIELNMSRWTVMRALDELKEEWKGITIWIG
jgi:hypothetical protein